jgi:thioredoxin-related protein
MLRSYGFLIVLLPALVLVASAVAPDNRAPRTEPSSINWLTPDEAMQLHAESGKKVLFYIFTTTCGFCQRTAAEVLVDPTVIDTMNELFLPVRVNAGSREPVQYNGETITSRELAGRLGTEYVPFYVVMEKNEIIGSRSGFHSPENLTALMVYYADEHYKQLPFEDFLRNW